MTENESQSWIAEARSETESHLSENEIVSASSVQRFSELCENLRVSSHQILTSELTGWNLR